MSISPQRPARRLWRWLEGDATRAGARAPAARPALPLSASVGTAPAPRDRRADLVAAFNPSHPTRHPRELRGRADALDALAEAMLWQRQHAVVHGARGSGKTSLVRIFADRADRAGTVLIYVSCEAKASFAELVRPFLLTIPASSLPVGADKAFRAEAQALGQDFGPQAVVSLLGALEPRPVIFILDEFDRITDSVVRDRVATFMKLLSDTLSAVQLLIVGIAQSVDELIASHPSLRRHVTAVSIGAIPDAEIDRLIVDGAARAGLIFEDAARAVIVRAACGSPYHGRLFAYSAGTRAVSRDGDVVDRADAVAGLSAAFDRWAALNRQDSALFERTAARLDAASRAALGAEVRRIARAEATADAPLVAVDPARAIAPLAAALVPGTIDTRPVFRDDVAPQFLVALLLVGDATQDESAAAHDRDRAHHAG